MLKIFEDIAIRQVGWIKAGIYALLIGAVYFSALTVLVDQWNNDDFSYCYYVPFFVIFLVWEKRKRLVVIPSSPSWKGMIFLAVGVLFYWLGELGGEYFTIYLSFWLVVVGIVWLHLGWAKVRTIWFALVMILAMFPPPNFVTVKASLGLKLISSQIGVWMLHLWGVSALREGNIIDLGFTQLQVVDACSGLRYLMPLMVLSLLFAHWFMGRFWKRLVLFASSVPLAVLINSFRIAMTGVLYRVAGEEMAKGFFHGFAGGIIFVFALPVFYVIVLILKRMPPRETGFKLQVADVTPRILEMSRAIKPVAVPRGYREALFQPRFAIVVMVLLCIFAMTNTLEFREKVSARKPFSLYPTTVDDWRGAREMIDQQVVAALKLDDYVSINYHDRKGRVVNFYAAYYEDQRKGESIHSPETCLPSSGWEFRETGTARVPMGAGRTPMTVSRAFMEKDGATEVTYYWFPMRGRVAANLYQVKLYNFWDAVTRHRTDGALVRAITPVYPAETEKEADQRLQRFVADMKPVLDEFLPH